LKKGKIGFTLPVIRGKYSSPTDLMDTAKAGQRRVKIVSRQAAKLAKKDQNLELKTLRTLRLSVALFSAIARGAFDRKFYY
jgi:hypothetical protein